MHKFFIDFAIFFSTCYLSTWNWWVCAVLYAAKVPVPRVRGPTTSDTSSVIYLRWWVHLLSIHSTHFLERSESPAHDYHLSCRHVMRRSFPRSSNSGERGQDVTIFQSLKKCQPIIKVLCDLTSCLASSSRFHERVFIRKISECPLKTSHVLCPPAELTTVISQDLPRGWQYYDPSLSVGKLQPFIDVSQEADWGQRQAGVRTWSSHDSWCVYFSRRCGQKFLSYFHPKSGRKSTLIPAWKL